MRGERSPDQQLLENRGFQGQEADGECYRSSLGATRVLRGAVGPGAALGVLLLGKGVLTAVDLLLVGSETPHGQITFSSALKLISV